MTGGASQPMTILQTNQPLPILLSTPQRTIHLVAEQQDSQPAIFLVQDKEIGGVLINSPPFIPEYQSILKPHEVNFIFLPSYFGANDISHWKSELNAEVLCHENEAVNIAEEVNITVNQKTKLSRTIDFIPIGGRTAGSCALFIKNLPGIIFFGPILQRGEDGWPSMKAQADDFSYESRLFSALGIKDLKFEHAFLDDYRINLSKTGPNAAIHVRDNIDQLFED